MEAKMIAGRMRKHLQKNGLWVDFISDINKVMNKYLISQHQQLLDTLREDTNVELSHDSIFIWEGIISRELRIDVWRKTPEQILEIVKKMRKEIKRYEPIDEFAYRD